MLYILQITFLFTIALHYSHANKSYVSQDICSIVDPNSLSSQPVQLSSDKILILQDCCVKYFALNLTNSSFKNKYIIVEVNFHNFTKELWYTPKFLQKIGSKPSLYADPKVNNHIEVNTYDSNAYMNRKTYHNIVLSPTDVEREGISYFAIYKIFKDIASYSNVSVAYDIQVRTSNTFPCPKNCSGNGICSESEKRCYCNEGFFDLDCSVQAVPLLQGLSRLESIDSRNWEYFYFRINNNFEDIRMTIEKAEGSVVLSLMVSTPKTFLLPNFYIKDGYFRLDQDTSRLDLGITQTLMNNDSEGEVQLLVGVYNTGECPVAVGVEISVLEKEGFGKTEIIFVSLGGFVAIVMLWGFIMFVKYKMARRNGTGTPSVGLKQSLTKIQIQHYFPRKKFTNFESSFPQTLCSICLEDYEVDSVCRQLYCEHIYHDDCIETWLSQNNNCPNCKKSMKKEDIETFLSSKIPKKKELVKKQPSLSCNIEISLQDMSSGIKNFNSRQQPEQVYCLEENSAEKMSIEITAKCANNSSSKNLSNKELNIINQRTKKRKAKSEM